LVGRGDPNLSGRVLPYQLKNERREPADAAFENLADQVAAQGIHEVSGNLIADDSYFLFEPYSHDWAVEDLLWGYGAPVTALAFNDNALALHVRPGSAAGEMAQVSTEPVPYYYQLENHVETGAAGTPKRIFVERPSGSRELDVWGQIPAGAGDNDSEGSLAIADPPQLIGQLFRHLLEQRGIVVRGRVEVVHVTQFQAATQRDGVDLFHPPPRVVLAEHRSLPLREHVKLMNKISQNLHAEMLLRTLGREVKNYGSLAAGLQALEEFSAQVGVEKGETHFVDGSGLSREALVTPHATVKLLEYMARSPRFDVFLDSLPQAGVDGTLSERLKNSAAAGRIRAKTGTLEHVNSLSGYMELPSGERLAFSMLGNNHNLDSRGGEELLDRTARAVFEWFARKKLK
jgi:D-alanyl-D-alanine carboxypeptidase/D-alanyl-D-alanine-endopeptidase (penicillin-binding protein 4)